MNDVLAVVTGSADTGSADTNVRAAAAALGPVFAGGVRELAVSAHHPVAGARRVLSELAATGAGAAVVAADPAPRALCWQVMSRAEKPIVLVPPGSRPLTAVRRVLLPLDGTEPSTAGMAQAVRLLDHTDAELVVLHVFDEATVPRFWDRAGHTYQAWAEEFLSRSAELAPARMRLRTGVVADQVIGAAAAEQVDLIALGWSRHLGGHHARTVRAAVVQAPVPVLLVSVQPVADPTPARAAGDERP